MGYLATYIIEEFLDYFNDKEDKILSLYKENCKRGFNDKVSKWKSILTTDLREKIGYTESETMNFSNSEFTERLFNVYLKQMYIYYFEMGFARFQPYEQEVVEALKPLIDKTSSEMLGYIQNNINQEVFIKIVGPISKSFINDAWQDGQSIAAMLLLNINNKK